MIIILEIIFYIIFIVLISWLIKKNKSEFFTFVLPGFIFFFFIDVMCIANQKHFFEKLHFPILGNPLIVPLTCVSMLCFLFFLNNKIIICFPKTKNIFILSLIAAFCGVAIDLILDPLAVKTGIFIYLNQPTRFLNVPLWNFIGWGIAIFIFFFAYYFFKKFDFKKRMILIYTYIFLILTGRFILYLISNRT